jgi:hypothetical protein
MELDESIGVSDLDLPNTGLFEFLSSDSLICHTCTDYSGTRETILFVPGAHQDAIRQHCESEVHGAALSYSRQSKLQKIEEAQDIMLNMSHFGLPFSDPPHRDRRFCTGLVLNPAFAPFLSARRTEGGGRTCEDIFHDILRDPDSMAAEELRHFKNFAELRRGGRPELVAEVEMRSKATMKWKVVDGRAYSTFCLGVVSDGLPVCHNCYDLKKLSAFRMYLLRLRCSAQTDADSARSRFANKRYLQNAAS